jgi:hypothetical protein
MVVHVYRAAIAPYPNDAAARRLVLRRIKGECRPFRQKPLLKNLVSISNLRVALESLIKTSFCYGLPKALNGFFPLIKAIPDDESVDTEVVRKDIKNPLDMKERGEQYMKQVFGPADLDTMWGTLDKYFPDLREYCPLHSTWFPMESSRGKITDLTCVQ